MNIINQMFHLPNGKADKFAIVGHMVQTIVMNFDLSLRDKQ